MNCKIRTILIALMLLGAQTSYGQERPNFLWIVSEDNSKHYLQMYDDTGAPTPNIESLSEHGLIFNHAFSSAAVCSAARSTLISGIYGPRIASHYHRNINRVNMPFDLSMFPTYLIEAGYHTSNDRKTDFNISNGTSIWTGGGRNDYGWRDREEGQPFFHFYTTNTSHESGTHFNNMNESVPFDPDTIFVEPRHPNTELFRFAGALYRKRITQADVNVGRVIDSLKRDGLYDDTFIFYFGDHGGVLPGSKGYAHETGLHVPLVIHIPENFEHLVDFEPGTRVDGFVSFVDFGVTVLNLAGIDVPDAFDGTPFLGSEVTAEEVNARNTTFSYADRFDEKYDFVRSVRRGRYKYTRNYEPFNPMGLFNAYRYRHLGMREWKELYEKGELNEVQASFFESKPVEALYDIENDPYETVNLASDQSYSSTVTELRGLLRDFQEEANDLSFYPEFYLIENAFPNTGSYGESNASQLGELMDIADLQLLDFSEAEASIESALQSDNPWHRYWALIVCSSFGQEASGFTSQVRDIRRDNSETASNRVRALEFLALQQNSNPANVAAELTDHMYQAGSLAECALYLNTMTMLKDQLDYKFVIDYEQIDEGFRSSFFVRGRVNYLYSVPDDTVSNVIPNGKYNLLHVDSEETSRRPAYAKYVFDDNPSTYWLTPNGRNMPHEIIFSLDELYSANGFRYLPRRDGSLNGTIGEYELYASDRLYDIRDSRNLVASGTWAADDSPKDVFFDALDAKFFRLVVVSNVSDNEVASAAEMRVFGDPTGRRGDTSTTVPDGNVGEGQTTATYQIVNRKSGKCLVNGDGGTSRGTPVVQNRCDGSSDEIWLVTNLGDGVFSMEHEATGLVADITGLSTVEGAENILWSPNEGDNQRWNIVALGADLYHIVNVNSDLLLDISEGSRANGAPSIQWPDNGGRNQDWYFLPAESSGSSARLVSTFDPIAEQVNASFVPEELIVYPNPLDGDGILTVRVPELYLDGQLTILNAGGEVLVGQVVKEANINIDLSRFGKGIYFLRVLSGEAMEVRKVIVE